MVAYGLGPPPPKRELRKAHPGVNQPWYADDAGARGTFRGIRRHLENLMVRGPPDGFFPEPTTRILVVSPQNVPRVEDFFRGYGLQIVMESCYLGGFVGSKAAQDIWLGEKVEGWWDSVATLARINIVRSCAYYRYV